MPKTVTSPLTLSGRYFSKKELIGIQQTIKTFPNLSLTELAQTFCEHLSWTTVQGRNKHNACLDALEKLEKLGLVELPSKRPQKQRESKKVVWTEQSQTKPAIDCSLVELGTITLKVVTNKAEAILWNEYIDRHHYLGYKHPIGAALKYFIMSDRIFSLFS